MYRLYKILPAYVTINNYSFFCGREQQPSFSYYITYQGETIKDIKLPFLQKVLHGASSTFYLKETPRESLWTSFVFFLGQKG